VSSLLELHAEALFVHDARGRITYVNEPGGARAPRCFASRARDGSGEVVRLRDDVAERPTELAPSGPAYAFPDELPAAEVALLGPGDFERVRELGWERAEFARDFAVRAPFCALIEGELAIALCFSARLTPRAAEAGVTTHPAHRRRGHGAAVVAAWARAIRATGRVPLYSTSWDNLASQALARRLGLACYAEDFASSAAIAS